jgi:hypothetical protein
MMKKYFIPLLIFAFGTAQAQQSLEVVFQDSLVVGNANSPAELIGYVHIKNNSTRTMEVLAKRIDINYTALTDSNAICWAGGCYVTTVSQSPFALSIDPDQTVTEFSAHVYPDGDGVVSSGPIRYVFFDKFNDNDSASVIIDFGLTQNFSITEKKLPSVSVFPNPASDFLKVELSNLNGGSAQFDLVDMVGNRVFTKSVDNEDTFDLNLNKLARGVYFYSLKKDNVVIETKKLIVR